MEKLKEVHAYYENKSEATVAAAEGADSVPNANQDAQTDSTEERNEDTKPTQDSQPDSTSPALQSQKEQKGNVAEKKDVIEKGDPRFKVEEDALDYSSTMDSRISGARETRREKEFASRAAKSEEGAAAAKIEVRPMVEIKDDPPDPKFQRSSREIRRHFLARKQQHELQLQQLQEKLDADMRDFERKVRSRRKATQKVLRERSEIYRQVDALEDESKASTGRLTLNRVPEAPRDQRASGTPSTPLSRRNRTAVGAAGQAVMPMSMTKTAQEFRDPAVRRHLGALESAEHAIENTLDLARKRLGDAKFRADQRDLDERRLQHAEMYAAINKLPRSKSAMYGELLRVRGDLKSATEKARRLNAAIKTQQNTIEILHHEVEVESSKVGPLQTELRKSRARTKTKIKELQRVYEVLKSTKIELAKYQETVDDMEKARAQLALELEEKEKEIEAEAKHAEEQKKKLEAEAKKMAKKLETDKQQAKLKFMQAQSKIGANLQKMKIARQQMEAEIKAKELEHAAKMKTTKKMAAAWGKKAAEKPLERQRNRAARTAAVLAAVTRTQGKMRKEFKEKLAAKEKEWEERYEKEFAQFNAEHTDALDAQRLLYEHQMEAKTKMLEDELRTIKASHSAEMEETTAMMQGKIDEQAKELKELRRQIEMHDDAMDVLRKEATRSQLQALEAIHDFSRTRVVGTTFEDLEDSTMEIFARREVPGEHDGIYLGQTRKITTRQKIVHHPASPVARLKTSSQW